MLVILWEFRAAAGRRDDLIAAYGPDGDRAALFRRAAGFGGTELWPDAEDPDLFLVLDRWASAADFAAFKERFGAEYAELDRACLALTAEERLLGRYFSPTYG